jgi:deoxyhypusine synthase
MATDGGKDVGGNEVPAATAAAVLVRSEPLPDDAVLVRGYEFGKGPVDYDALLGSYERTGYQATHFGRAIGIVNGMLNWRPPGCPSSDQDEELEDLRGGTESGQTDRCRIFLGYTSNLVSSGLRESIRFLVENSMVEVVVSTAGGVEEDLIKCLAPTAVGDFRLDGASLRKRGLNRIGNLLVPNDNYCKFEDWVLPVLDEALEDQKENGTIYTPSKLIALLGKRIDNPDSICYWAYKNDIPIYCPALTDGSLGDMIFFHSYKNPGLIVDLVGDIRGINRSAMDAACTGVIILGGGVIKHHIANANLMRNGADFAVYINTGMEFDGSDSGASVDEAVSWGKIKGAAQQIKVCADATLVFPLLVAQTFAKHLETTSSVNNGV